MQLNGTEPLTPCRKKEKEQKGGVGGEYSVQKVALTCAEKNMTKKRWVDR